LAHNVRDAGTGQPKADVLYTFDRAGSLDVEAIRRLTKSLSRFLTPEEALKIQGPDHGEATLRFLKSVPAGGAHLLRGLWEQLGLPKALSQCMKDERIQAHVFLCFLALLLVRIAERKTGMTWDRIKDQMERLHPGEFFSKDGRVLQTTEPATEQLNILKQLKISPQERIRHIVMTP
jgi:hypothetical protein